MKQEKEYRIFELIREMPELRNKLPNEKYDPEKSEVLKWLASTEILQCLFRTAQNKKLVTYDPDTGKWHGIQNDNEMECNFNKKWRKGVQKANRRKHENSQRELEHTFEQLSENGRPVITQQIASYLNINRSTLYKRISKSNRLIINNGMVEKIKRGE